MGPVAPEGSSSASSSGSGSQYKSEPVFSKDAILAESGVAEGDEGTTVRGTRHIDTAPAVAPVVLTPSSRRSNERAR